jgi:hypothetical protein
MEQAENIPRVTKELFGSGNSASAFHHILLRPSIWSADIQKYFIDRSIPA